MCIIFLDTTKLQLVWKKEQYFLNDAFKLYYDLIKLTDWYKTSDFYVNHNNYLGHMLIT